MIITNCITRLNNRKQFKMRYLPVGADGWMRWDGWYGRDGRDGWDGCGMEKEREIGKEWEDFCRL